MPKQVLYFDETSVILLAPLIANFCDEKFKFYKYGTDHLGLFKALVRTGYVANVYSQLNMSYVKDGPPRELLAAIQSFLVPGKISDQTLTNMFVRHVKGTQYKAKYRATEEKRLLKDFEIFKTAVVAHINKNHNKHGIYMEMSRKKSKAKRTGND